MANFPGLILTADGRNLQAKAQIGQPLHFLRVALGDGHPPDNPEGLAGLINERQSLSIQDMEVVGDGTSRLRVILTNQGVIAGFFVREIGIFARDPDTQQERLYAYSNSGEQSDFLPAEGGATLVEQIFDLITVIGSAQSVTALIDDYITIATKADIETIRPYTLPAGGHPGEVPIKQSNAEGDVAWADLSKGVPMRVHSVSEKRIAVGSQRTFSLRDTITPGLAIYINGLRLPGDAWIALSNTQVRLNDAVDSGDVVEFVNNEEVGTVTLASVSLVGPSLVYPDSASDYIISDYDAFSDYQVATDVGAVSRDGDTITLSVPAVAEAPALVLSVSRNGGMHTYGIAVGSESVAAPEILSPASGDTNVSTLPTATSSLFATYPRSMDTHASTDWQIATDAAFSDIVAESLGDTANLESWSPGSLPRATTLYIRARHQGAALGPSDWSAPVQFTTADRYIDRPTLVSPTQGATDVPESPILQASPFATTPAASDTHQATSWRIRDESGSLVWSSLSDAVNRTSIAVPAGVLRVASIYTVEVQYIGHTLAPSEWGSASFATAETFVPEDGAEGEPFGGGYFVARMKDESDNWYALVVAPAAEGGNNGNSANWANARAYAQGLAIGGHDDWDLPTLHEMRLLYRKFKPTTGANSTGHGATDRVDPPLGNYTSDSPARTSLTDWQSGGAEAFAVTNHWTADESGSSAWGATFYGGTETLNTKTYDRWVRAVRRVYF